MISCARSSRGGAERIAVLPFDNLTAEPALDWIVSAAPAIVAEQLTGAAAVSSFRAQTLGDAYGARATRFVHGYFERRGGNLHFEMTLEDAGSHKMVLSTAVNGDLLPAMNTLARTIDPTAVAFSTSNPEAAAAWGQGDYERAVSLDQDFSGAWVNWVQLRMGAGDSEGALKIANDGLARPLRSSVNRAQLDLLGATLRKDQGGREQALVTLAGLLPGDSGLARTLADLEMSLRRFPQAVKRYQDVARLDPDDLSAPNLLGYAQAFAGDLDSAQKSFEQYGREPGQEANSRDSLGEAMFLRGRFAEAEKHFLEAHAKNSAMLGGGDLLKAAYARWLQGDLPKADEIFTQYRAFRTQLKDPLMFWREAVWDYSTGRSEQAIKLLQSASGPTAQIAEKQLAVWRDPNSVPHDRAVLKEIYDRTPPATDGLIRTLYAAALVEAGQKEQARALIELWPLPEQAGDDLLRAFLYPRFLELRRQLK